MSLFAELKRRNVFRVAVAYLITSWVLLQVADLVLQNIHAPDWVIQAFMLALGLGFPVAVIFAWAFEMTPEGLKKEKNVDRTQSITSQTGRKLDFTIIGVLAVAVVFLLVDRFTPEKGPGNPVPDTTQQDPSASDENVSLTPTLTVPVLKPLAKSIAVLPFVNMSSDPEQEFFSDGISEEILNALARVKELKVAGRTSSFAFKGQNQDLRTIGKTLGVANILEGSVRKSGNTVRITAQLIQVEDGFHLWSDTYDRELDNVFAIQDEISTAILEQLKATLIGEDAVDVTAERTSTEAYELYLLAKQRIYERKELPLQSALALLDQAIALDPNYAPAFAQRGIATLMLADDSYGSIPEEEATAQARLYVEKALVLEPDSAEANAAAGLYHLNRPGENELAVVALRKALEANPSMVDAANWLQTALSNLGLQEESNTVLYAMVERDPLYRPGLNNIILAYNGLGWTQESWDLISRVSPFFPNDPMISRLKGMTYLSEGHPGDALPLLQSAMEEEPGSAANRAWGGQALMQTGQYEKALEIDDQDIRGWALFTLGRMEEVNMIAAEQAASGKNVSGLMGLMVYEGKNAEMIEFFESRWPDFATYEAEYPPLGRGSIQVFADIAVAYGAVGNEERYLEALSRFRFNLDKAHELGWKFSFMPFMEAIYFTMSGDHEQAMAFLDQAVNEGYLGQPRMSKDFIQLKELEGDPVYEAIQARMVEHLNAERAKVGLGPMST